MALKCAGKSARRDVLVRLSVDDERMLERTRISLAVNKGEMVSRAEVLRRGLALVAKQEGASE